MTTATRDQILSSLTSMDREDLKRLKDFGRVPHIATLSKFMRLGLVVKTRDGYAVTEG